ncbi:MAG TPA: hypothetical protein VLG76_08040 [Rhabdochlamydiaceae bacterium]|nr:hypothetical protein [Rhabdochlamydiaceae bacterium]
MKKSDQFNESQILLYQTEDGRQRIEVRLENETVWLSQKLMAELFQTTPQNINIHLKNIFSEGELFPESVSKESLTTASDGKKYRKRADASKPNMGLTTWDGAGRRKTLVIPIATNNFIFELRESAANRRS